MSKENRFYFFSNFIFCLVVLVLSCGRNVSNPNASNITDGSVDGYAVATVNVQFTDKSEKVKVQEKNGYTSLLVIAPDNDTIYQKLWNYPDTVPASFSTGQIKTADSVVFMLMIYNKNDTLTYFGADTVNLVEGSDIDVSINVYPMFGSIKMFVDIPDSLVASVERIETSLEIQRMSPIIKEFGIVGDSAFCEFKNIPSNKDIIITILVYNNKDDLIYSGKDTIKLESGQVKEVNVDLKSIGSSAGVSVTFKNEGSVNLNVLFPNQSTTEDTGMILISGGEFLMGPESVSVSVDSFWIDKYEVTNSQFADFLKSSPDLMEYYNDSMKIDTSGGTVTVLSGYENHPVTWVTWYAADTFCAYQNKILPSDTMWEKAARGTDGYTFPWGEAPADTSYLNYNNKFGGTTEVGRFEKGKSSFGIYDMSGNVYEWCSTKDSNSSKYIRKGGGWNSTQSYCKPEYIGKSTRTTKTKALGFRCARIK